MTTQGQRRTRGSSPEQARRVRQEGHDNALLFALSIGLPNDYQNDRQAKKDVIDPSGDAHSLKSGVKKWQLFLYTRTRFQSDLGFQTMDGIGKLLMECIDAFPPTFDEYQTQKLAAKEKLRTPMAGLKERFQSPVLRKAFLMKSIFNGGEVNYLTVLHEGRYHVFLNSEVVDVMGDSFEVVNSGGNPPGQKVLFKYGGYNVGELEMRNDSAVHYREIRFNMIIKKAVELLLPITPTANFSEEVVVHGKAIPRFGNWKPNWRNT